jgi:signal recognition particle receptor subunit beta
MTKKSLFYRVQKWAHTHVPSEIHVLGPYGAGKTTFYEQLKLRRSDPGIVLHTQHVNHYEFSEHLSNVELLLADAAGDDKFRMDWAEILRERPPLGIIFVLDHDCGKRGTEALQHLYNALENNKKKRPKIAITKGILVFLNKFDEWHRKYEPYHLMQQYQSEITRFRDLDVIPIVRYGSARFYAQHKRLFDDAMDAFFQVLFDPSADVAFELPEEQG